ncbi:hypothetical protein [Paenibacillus aceti]|uniref:DUF4355 domain-containing protein n=1 Tax=Paenibacillus aceti TaxID=1820010 RepID=A0ABQ1W627_9BACL|nr:hypothetical protein [Paenibacillus aceti]GGG16215.1 hypothetical protein GCM10010913_42810 [Paenibacillus aceti]
MEFTEEQQTHINQIIADEKATWESEQLAPVIAERDELLKFQPKEESEQEKMIKQLQAELNHQRLVSALEKANLIDFIDYVSADDESEMQSKIDNLSTVLEARTVNKSFVPDNHKQTSAYERSAAKGDTLGMIKALFK